MMAKVKITIVKRVVHEDLIDSHINKEGCPDGFGRCPLWNEKEEFIVEGWPDKPADFPCDWARTDIQRDVAMLNVRGESAVDAKARDGDILLQRRVPTGLLPDRADHGVGNAPDQSLSRNSSLFGYF